MEIEIKRVYDEPSKKDGVRIFVDRLWPRGVKKEDLVMDAWIKDIAPSPELRKWFGHDPARFKAFEKKYDEELKSTQPLWMPQIEKYADKKMTLLYAAKDPDINHALCLKSYLMKNL
jgi:uncharacterized protein YeaO (DUF488 family)